MEKTQDTMTAYYVLPGFLGLPSDWNFLGLPLVQISCYKPLDMGLKAWGAAFNAQAHPGVLIGYSLGGRLAIHAALDKPSLWQALILISSHTGLSDEKLKDERLKSDRAWAQRFANDPWDSVIQAWNSQPVFQGSHNPIRNEGDYSRGQLASILEGWSLGYQEDLAPRIQHLAIPILWIAGSEDTACVNRTQSLRFTHPKSKKWIAPQSGHRVYLDTPEHLKKEINNFLKGLL